MKLNYKHTMYACFGGYVVQAIVNNFLPLLFLTFQSSYGIPIGKITFLVTFNFGLQLVIDFLSPGIIDRLGYRVCIVAAHFFVAAGLLSLVLLPELFADPFVGLMTAVVIYAVGGGLLEVLVSPIVEACPGDNKEGAMSLLHSFYCWGHVAVVLLSAIFFSLFGIENWKVMAMLWAVIPLCNAFVFMKVPMASLLAEGETGMSPKELLATPLFWLLALLMVCAGASEQAVSQWASAFAEMGLGISKTMGDLAGPMFFAVMMGLARLLYGKFSEKIEIKKTILASGLLCVCCYLVISLSPWAAGSLIGCGVCGFSVGVLWPGVFSMSAASIRRGATTMFAWLALAGDLGCSLGPTVAGSVAGMAGDDLKAGILAAVVFPVVLILGMLVLQRKKDRF